MSWDLFEKKEKPELPFEEVWLTPERIIQKTGLKVLVWGEPEVGKTHFALTFPEPIYVIDTEFGVAPLLAKEPFKSKEVYVYEAARLSEETAEIDPAASLDAVEKALTVLLRKQLTKGTVVIDSVTDIWQWHQAWLEQLSDVRRTQTGQILRFEWGRANMRYRKLILRLMARPVHVVLTAQSQEVYDAQGHPTGVYRPRAQRQTAHMVDIVLHLEKVYDPTSRAVKYYATLEKCRFQRGLNKRIESVTYDKLVATLREIGVEVV